MKNHILIIASYAPSLLNFRGPLLKKMIAMGHQVTAVAPIDDLSESEQDDIKSGLLDIGVVFKTVPLSRTGLNPLKDLSYFLSLKKIMQETKADRILAYTIKPVIYSGLAARTIKHPHYYPMFTGLGYAFTKGAGLKKQLLKTLSTKLLKLAMNPAKTVIFQNPDDQDLVSKAGILKQQQHMEIIDGSGVDLSYYPAKILEDSPKDITFLMIARVLIDKGVREYAEAAKNIKTHYPHCHFILVGPIDEGNPSSPSQEEIKSWNAIEYLGSASDVRSHLESCHVYVLPSYREGTPRSVLEAMATGRAVITTDAPGCRETVIDGQNGFLVMPRDAKSLEKAMQRFIHDPQLCLSMGEAGLKIVQHKYDVHIVNAKLLNIMNITDSEK